MPLAPALPLTPLQSLLGFDYLPYRYHGAIELLFAFVCFASCDRPTPASSDPHLAQLHDAWAGHVYRSVGGSAIANPRIAAGFARRRGVAVLLGRGPDPDGRGRLSLAPIRRDDIEHPARSDQPCASMPRCWSACWRPTSRSMSIPWSRRSACSAW